MIADKPSVTRRTGFLLEKTMSIDVHKLVTNAICRELLFNQALVDSRENRGMAYRSIICWVKSCVFAWDG